MLFPSRHDALTDKHKFMEIVKLIRDNKFNVKQVDIARYLNISPASLNRKLWEKRDFTITERENLVYYIYLNHQNADAARVISGLDELSEHYLYFSLLKYLEAKPEDQNFVQNCLFGTYELWRFSTEHDDEFVCGKIVFTRDEATDCVSAEMNQPIRARNGVPENRETFNGYVVSVSGMLFMILKNANNSDIRVTIFYRYRDEAIETTDLPETLQSHRHIVHLDGFNIGIDGRSAFFSPVYLVYLRTHEEIARLEERMDVVDEAEVPPRILKRLKKIPRSVR